MRGVDPAEGLARLERMAQRARARREQDEAKERRQQEAEDQRRTREELRQRQEAYLAGPPNGCAVCYVWRRGYIGVGFRWDWWHVEAINPVMRPWPDADDEPAEYCTHACHGPDGHPLPVIAYA
jgi:hypothetical protein